MPKRLLYIVSIVIAGCAANLTLNYPEIGEEISTCKLSLPQRTITRENVKFDIPKIALTHKPSDESRILADAYMDLARRANDYADSVAQAERRYTECANKFK